MSVREQAGYDRLADAARAILSARRIRDAAFSDGKVSDPVWTMLLDLYVASHEDRRVSVTGLIEAVQVPATTALRWIGYLAARDYVLRTPQVHDRRVVLISLTPLGIDTVSRCIEAMRLALRGVIAGPSGGEHHPT